MTFIRDGYVCRRTASSSSHGFLRAGDKLSKFGRNPTGFRDWWLGKKNISLNQIIIPVEYHGKKIRFKIEVLNNDCR